MIRSFCCIIFLILSLFFLETKSDNNNCNRLGIKNHYSQTNIFTRPAYFNIQAWQAFWHNIIYCNPENLNTSAQVMMFYQKSSDNAATKKNQKISEYFLMKDRYFLTVKGDLVGTSTIRDIRAEWLQLPNDFTGTFSLFPEQKQIAFVIDIKQNLRGCFQCSLLEYFWLGFSAVVTSVDNDLNLTQDVPNNQKPTIIDALRRPNLTYGKFYGKSSTAGFSELRFKFGTEFNFRDECQVNAHTYLLFPLAENPNPNVIFPAFRGFGNHFGLGTVVDFQIPLNCRKSPYLFALNFDIEMLYLFRNKQLRSMDLRNKPWSRFLLLNRFDGTITNIPAINVLTRKVKVDPYYMIDLSAGFRFRQNNFEAEVGYGLWAHSDERIRLDDCFLSEWGIAAKPGDLTTDGIPATASESTIATLAKTDKDEHGNFIFVPIQENQIDLYSGGSRGTITHRVNIALGYTLRGKCNNGFIGIGGFFEIPQNNCALQQWGFWAKIGSTF